MTSGSVSKPNSLFSKQIAFWSMLPAMVVVTALAWEYGEWRLTNLVITFLFGFFLQRGSFCGASILSSVVLLKDLRGVGGLGLAIFTTMVGFAGLAALGWVDPNPFQMNLLPGILGGTVFGVGMVLAGGCISGSLYKAGEGRLNSMLALVGMAVGGALVGTELIVQYRVTLSMYLMDLDLPTSLDEAVEIPYAVLAAGVGIAGLASFLLFARLRKKDGAPSKLLPEKWITGSWSFAVAGILIGVLGWLAYLSFSTSGRNYPLSPTRSVVTLFRVLIGEGSAAGWWRAGEALAVIAGSTTSAWMCGQLRLRSADKATLAVSLLGGVLAGAGGVIGSACFFGNMVSGWALFSLHSVVFAIFMVLANWATTILYLRGLRS